MTETGRTKMVDELEEIFSEIRKNTLMTVYAACANMTVTMALTALQTNARDSSVMTVSS